MGRTVGQLLDQARRDAVVGRDDDLDLLMSTVSDPSLVMTYLHGPGGVGKSALLGLVAHRLGESDRLVVVVDCSDLVATAAGLTAALTRAAGAGLHALPPETVLLVDRFEAVEPLAPWFWREVVPSLPHGVHLVVAGRRPPDRAWLADPAFAACARVVPLRNLAPPAAASLLAARGVPQDRVGRLVRLTHGHPLALVIAADTVATAAPAAEDPWSHPDAAGRLLGAFLEDGVSDLHRRALHVCGHARRVDRALLRVVLDVSDHAADEVLEWLRRRPYAESHPDGLSVHDVVRDVLDHDLRWRDRAAFVALHARVRDEVVRRLSTATGPEHFRCAGDLLFLHRTNPRTHDIYSYDTMGTAVSRPALRTPAERSWALSALASEARRDAGAYWWDEQPEAWTVVEDAWGARVGVVLATRPAASQHATEHDAVWAWCRNTVSTIRPVEPGEVVSHQLAVDVRAPGAVGQVSDQAAAVALREWSVPGLGWVFASSAHEAGWAPLWEYVGLERLGSVEVDGVEVGVWARDFARSPFAEWLELMGDLELDVDGSAPPPVAQPVALSRADFGAAVRSLLVTVRDGGSLRANPLVGSRLALPSADPPAELARRLRDAVRVVRDAPGSELAGRALESTYIARIVPQDRAARMLHVSHSTFRRHLAVGARLLDELLWEWEIHGPPAPGDPVDHDLTTD